MYLENFISAPADILAKAMGHPALAPKRKPTIEVALKAVAVELERECIDRVRDKMMPDFNDMYDMYVIDNGEYGDVEPERQNDYGAALDDRVEKIIEPLEALLSADWLGTHTIETRLWEEGAILKLSESLGKEIYKQLSYGKTPAQTLVNAGITKPMVEKALDEHLNSEPKEDAPMSDLSLEAVALKIKTRIGDDFDIMATLEEIELAIDDDPILSVGAGARLGLDEDETQSLQMVVIDEGAQASEVILNAVREATAPKATRAKKGEAKPKKPKVEMPEGDPIDPDVLTLIKEHGGTNDTAVAKALGISRATFLKYQKGEADFVLTDEQNEALRGILVEHVNGLLEAVAKFDKADQMAIS